MANYKQAINHKDLEQLKKECKEKFPELDVLDYKNEQEGIQKRKYVLVTDGTQEKWIMWSNLLKRGCKFNKSQKVWNLDSIQGKIVEMGYNNILVLDTYITSGRKVVLTDGIKTYIRSWNHIVMTNKIELERCLYKDEYVQNLIDKNMSDCEILEINRCEKISKNGRKDYTIKITYVYKKRQMTNTLDWALKREFEKAMNEDTLKEKYPTIEWERFKILRIYSERKSGKYRTLVDINDSKYNEIKVGMDTSNLPIPTMSGLNLSEGELKIREWLIENNIEYETEKTFNGLIYKQPLRLDFYLPKLNVAIEFDGVYHFQAFDWVGGETTLEMNKIRDSIKDRFCKDNNIKLIRIPYWEYKNIANILSQDIV